MLTSHTYYYQNPLGRIEYDPLGFVRLTWADAPIEPAALQSLYRHTLAALRHFSTGRLLTDQRLRAPLPEQQQQWIAEHWIPHAVADCGYSHCAIVENHDAAARLAARHVGSRVNVPLAFAYFQSEDDARAWLHMTTLG